MKKEKTQETWNENVDWGDAESCLRCYYRRHCRRWNDVLFEAVKGGQHQAFLGRVTAESCRDFKEGK